MFSKSIQFYSYIMSDINYLILLTQIFKVLTANLAFDAVDNRKDCVKKTTFFINWSIIIMKNKNYTNFALKRLLIKLTKSSFA